VRTTYLICYDIANDKRLRRVFKVCKDYGVHLQYSVFESDLSASEKTELERKLAAEINSREDQVLFVELGPAAGRGERLIQALGDRTRTSTLPVLWYKVVP
jgi:CRISPR-associated protein Cas2